MKEITVKFWCNAGYTEKIVKVEIEEESYKSEDKQIEDEFYKWLDNNEECGWEKI